jgi:hypothetical protein
MPKKSSQTNRATEQQASLLSVLEQRFEQNTNRHVGIQWSKVLAKLDAEKGKLESLRQMEASGGEPDVVGFDKKTGQFTFFDCSPETPVGRRSVCYDREGLESRKEHRPANSAVDMARAMGIELLTEEQYRHLQTFGNFDTRTSSWLKTPKSIRELGGAIFGDFRYGQTFVYHNGAQSYYGVRGFRGCLIV